MNEVELESFPFDSIVDDREYEASIFRNYFGKFLTTGVYFGLYNNYGDYSMKVVADTGLNVKVTKGCGLIKGADYNLKNDTILSINMPIGANRKDMIVVRLDDKLEVRKTKLYVKEGTATDFATLERTTDVYEICLAKIVVGDRALTVTIDDITDTRRDGELCGIVTSLIDIDIQDVLDDITTKKDNFFANLNIITEQDKAEFWQRLEAWFQTLQDVLDGDVAGNLLNLINTKSNKKKTWNIELDTTWTGTEAPYTKTVSVQGMLATDEANIYPVWSETLATRQTEKEEYNKISMVTSGENSITLTCDEEKPEIALNARIEVMY